MPELSPFAPSLMAEFISVPEPTYVVSVGAGIYSKDWQPTGPLTFSALIDALPGMPCFMGGTLAGPERTTANLNERTLFTLDEDDAGDDPAVWETRVAAVISDVPHAYWETKSSTPEALRYRLLAVPDRAMTGREYRRAALALMDLLKWGKDLSGAREVQLQRGPGSAPITVGGLDGAGLSVDMLLAHADALGIENPTDREPSEPWDGTPPTAKQLDKGETILRKYIAATENPRKAGYEGRSDALISMLPTLLRFAASGTLDEEDVIEGMRSAALAAPGDHAFDEREFESVLARARAYADEDGQAVPKVIEAEDEFEALPDDEDASGPPTRTPDAYFVQGGGFRALLLADDVAARLPCAADALDSGRLWTYANGVWSPGVARVKEIVINLLGDRYRSSHFNNITDILMGREGRRVITGDPVEQCINLRNGLLDWRTGELMPHDADVLSTVQLTAAWDPDAACPAFDGFLTDVLPADLLAPQGDGGDAFIWELLGYLLYNGNPLHIAVLLDGTGRNGKGTWVRTLERLFGPGNYASVSPQDMSDNKFRTAQLYGMPINLVGDVDARYVTGTGAFKKSTGGDVLTGEHKYGQPFTFTPWSTSVFSINEAFSAADSSEGYFARWVVLPFLTRLLGREDPLMTARITTPHELAGIVARGVRALPALLERGRLTEPDSVRVAKQRFVLASDSFRAWMDDTCLMDPDGWVPNGALWDAYRYGDVDARHRLGKNKFFAKVAQVEGIERGQRQGVRGFRGLGLRGEFEDLL